ncbi:DUF3137 domain-containing protein [Desertihabitans brevis]|uniref:DUF3137 domain-containing protein n=1 Tax=Desertihabitans brevis TaxID=2268447 RepID=UPI0011BE5F73|nr:DUF3137 domain-containing protein [Desertihabitans brevis]
MSTGDVVAILIGVLVLGGIVLGIVLAVRRHRWIKGMREKGWEFVDSPHLAITADLGCPPFGQGFVRKVDDQVLGQVGSPPVPFQMVEYHARSFDDELAVLKLPFALPELYVCDGSTARVGCVGEVHPHPRWTVLTTDHAAADAVLGACGPALEALAATGHKVDLGIDGSNLVALSAPREAEHLDPFLQALAGVAHGLATLERHRVPEPARPPFPFYRRPDWVYHGRRDDLLRTVRHQTGGFGHRAEHVLTGDSGQLPFIALRHHWKTQTTVTTSDGRGGTTTRTQTNHHSEDLLEITLPAAWPFLLVGDAGWFAGGEKVELESARFNELFDVRSDSPKLAYDVLHPRQMEYLMQSRPPTFTLSGTVLRVSSSHDTEWIGHTLDVLTGFLARVPGWVWKNLGVPEPSFTRPELG